MKRLVTIAAWAIVILTAVTFAEAAQRGRTGGRNERGGSSGRETQERERNESSRNTQVEREGANKAPGGAWSERTHSGWSANSQFGKENEHSPAGAAAAGNAAGKNKAGQPSAAQGAAAGAAVNNRRSPQATGAQGAAAGAAAANRNNPNLSGAQGAAAGAAASNGNNPNLSGAQGAAAGAAAANRNNPNLSGAQGAAVGAAAANRNSPQFSGAQGAAAGAAAANRARLRRCGWIRCGQNRRLLSKHVRWRLVRRESGRLDGDGLGGWRSVGSHAVELAGWYVRLRQ
jgi:hypothetical protein